MTEKKKGPTRAQLVERNVVLSQANAALRAEIAKLTTPDPVRRAGEHWYELISLFDPGQITTLPAVAGIGRAYVLGSLSGMLVVEFPRDAQPDAVRALMRNLADQGLGPVFAVSEGVRFVRLRALDAAEERQVDEEVLRAEAERVAGARPELHSDGVGSDHERGRGPRDGGHRDGEGEGHGAPDGGGG